MSAAVPTLAGAATLLLGLLLPLRFGAPEAAGRLVAAQGGTVALAAASAAWTEAGGAALWLLAFGALGARALPLPTLLRLAFGPGAARRAAAGRAPAAGVAPLLAGGALAVLAFAAVSAVGAGVEAEAREGMALALAAVLAGWLAMLNGRGAWRGLLGLLAAENGALLGLAHAGDGGLPAAAVLAAAVLSPGLLFCLALALARREAGAFAAALPWAARR